MNGTIACSGDVTRARQTRFARMLRCCELLLILHVPMHVTCLCMQVMELLEATVGAGVFLAAVTKTNQALEGKKEKRKVRTLLERYY